MIRNFKNKKLVDNLVQLLSTDRYKQVKAEEYFYSGQLKSKDISNLFFGLLKLAFEHNYTVVILFDEIQFLDEIDPSKVLVKMFSEQFMRLLFEQFSNNRLYLVVSCLQNPQKNEWDLLKSRSKNFQSIVKGKEIILGNLTLNEREEIVNQVSSRIGFQKNDRSVFLSKVKSSLDYYLPRYLLQCIANILDMMEYTAYNDYEIRKLYEKDARNYISPKLKEMGFKYIESGVKKIGGYNVDIFASAPTSRAKYRKQAFGEVTMMKRSGMVEKIEKFANWLNRMNSLEYKPEKGDIAFFICPPNRITENSNMILKDNNINLYEYSSKNIEELAKVSKPKSIPEKKSLNDIKKVKPKEDIILIKDPKYSLEDIKGIAKTTADKLRKASINTLKELINCNSKTTASEIDRVGKTSIDNWKQIAKQLLYG